MLIANVNLIFFCYLQVLSSQVFEKRKVLLCREAQMSLLLSSAGVVVITAVTRRCRHKYCCHPQVLFSLLLSAVSVAVFTAVIWMYCCFNWCCLQLLLFLPRLLKGIFTLTAVTWRCCCLNCRYLQVLSSCCPEGLKFHQLHTALVLHCSWWYSTALHSTNFSPSPYLYLFLHPPGRISRPVLLCFLWPKFLLCRCREILPAEGGLSKGHRKSFFSL